MTIYDDGVKKEAVELPKSSIPDMHAIMVEKGFVKKKVEETKLTVKAVVANKEAEVSKKTVALKANAMQKKTEVSQKDSGKIAEATVEYVDDNGRDKLSKQLKRQRLNEEVVPPPPQMTKIYIISAMILCGIFLLLRARTRRRSLRYTV